MDRAEGAFPDRARVYKLEEAISKRLYCRSKGVSRPRAALADNRRLAARLTP